MKINAILCAILLALGLAACDQPQQQDEPADQQQPEEEVPPQGAPATMPEERATMQPATTAPETSEYQTEDETAEEGDAAEPPPSP